MIGLYSKPFFELFKVFPSVPSSPEVSLSFPLRRPFGKKLKRKYVYNYRLKRSRSLFRTVCRLWGMSHTKARLVACLLGTPSYIRLRKLCFRKVNSISRMLKKFFIVERRLKKYVYSNLAFKIKVGYYVGLRYSMGLPAYGQRTHSNARTSRKRKAARLLLRKEKLSTKKVVTKKIKTKVSPK